MPYPNLTMLSRFRHVETSYIDTGFIFRLATYYSRDYSKTIQDERTKKSKTAIYLYCVYKGNIYIRVAKPLTKGK